MNHHSHVEAVPAALAELGACRALVVQAIEGSDEAPLDGNSALVRVKSGEIEEFRVLPKSLGLSRATKADILWKGEKNEAHQLLSALAGEEGPVHDLILYNAALRLWVAGETTPLEDHLEDARVVLHSGEALELVEGLRGRVTMSG